MKRIAYCITFLFCLILTIRAFGQISETVNGIRTVSHQSTNFKTDVPYTGSNYPFNKVIAWLIYDNGTLANMPPA